MNRTLDLLKNNDNFLIITHKKPDGDTTGSASALCQILRTLGKTAFILKNPDITPKYEFLIEDYYSDDNFKPDFIITTDIASKDLFTENAKQYDIDLCIDHHFLSNTSYAKENLVLDYGACGEIIFELSKELGVPLNKELATAIYVSISTDTGCFRYSNTTKHTYIVASECVEHINVGEINRNLFDMRTKSRLDIEQRILNNIEFYFDGKVSLIKILQKDKLETGATPDDLDNIASLPRSIEGVVVAITLNEYENGDIKVSVRSSGDVNVSEICEKFGGGGHLRAAGCTFKSIDIDAAKDQMLKATQLVSKYV